MATGKEKIQGGRKGFGFVHAIAEAFIKGTSGAEGVQRFRARPGPNFKNLSERLAKRRSALADMQTTPEQVSAGARDIREVPQSRTHYNAGFEESNEPTPIVSFKRRV